VVGSGGRACGTKGYPEVGHHSILGFRREHGEDLTLAIRVAGTFLPETRRSNLLGCHPSVEATSFTSGNHEYAGVIATLALARDAVSALAAQTELNVEGTH